MNEMTRSLTIGLLLLLFSTADSKSVRKSPDEAMHYLKTAVARWLEYTDDDILAPLTKTPRTENSGQVWVNYSDPELLWNPSDIPYFIDPSLENYTRAIRSPIQEFERVSCINFREVYSNETDSWPDDFLYFKNTTGCASFIGRQGGAQLISVEAETCTGGGYGLVMHLIFHALGFGHEHNRPDRDKAIKIHWKNVNETKKQYLIKYNATDAATYGESYDYNSLLHGSNYLFAVNRTEKTITARNDSNLPLGQRDGFSEADIRRLNARYPCPTTATSTVTTTAASTATTAVTLPSTNSPPSRCEGSQNEPTCDGETRPTLTDPHDCTKYYVCQPDIVGYHLIQMPCPEGLIYNSSIYVCDYPRNTVCCTSQTKHRDLHKNIVRVGIK